MVRVLLVGQSGAGKSTIANILFHRSIEYQQLRNPAKTSRAADGCTTTLQRLIINSTDSIFDSPGFSDGESESPLVLLTKLRKFLVAVQIQFTHVCLVIPHNRLTAATVKSWAILKSIFGSELRKKVIIIITHCDESTITIDSFLQVNQHLQSTNKIITKIFQIYQKTPNHIITCSLQSDSTPSQDAFFKPKRELFLTQIQNILNDPETAKEYRLSPVRRTLREYIKLFCDSISSLLPKSRSTYRDLGDIFLAELERQLRFSKGTNVELTHHFPVCTLCGLNSYDLEEMQPCIPRQCGHIFHRRCLTEHCINTARTCPTCSTAIREEAICNLPLGLDEIDLEKGKDGEETKLILC